MSLSTLSQIILNSLPQTGVDIAFGYGSRVVKQGGRQTSSDLVDIIVSVDDPLRWHQENYSKNSQHYSFLKYMPNNIETITTIQEKYGARVYYNPYVRIGNLSAKYGVIRTSHLIGDLSQWETLYVAGRLHKPVEFILNTSDKNERLRSAIRFNKESALRAALLQLPETFDTMQLYKTISGLSYKGDLRMIFGEDRNKIDNIVSSQMDRFDELYIPIIKSNPSFSNSVHWNETKQIFTQDLSNATILKNLKLLPHRVRQTICRSHGQMVKTTEFDVVLASASRSLNCDKIVAHAIASIVKRSSLSQSLKGILTAGLIKSLKYSHKKLVKSLTSRLNLN